MERHTIDVVTKLRNYNQNTENNMLKSLYTGRTVFDIIGKGRNETAHSAFLSWLLSGTDIPGTSSDNTLIGLLDIVMRRIDEQNNDMKDMDSIRSISNALLSRTIKLTNIKSQTEKSVLSVASKEMKETVAAGEIKKGKKDSVDIYITCDISGVSNIQRLEFFIENKIGSKEGGPKDNASSDYDRLSQTNRYYQACYKKKQEGLGLCQFFIYLSAYDSYTLKNERPCESDKYVCINYQDIYDDILSPLLESEKLADREEALIKEYVRVLSIPMEFKCNDIADGSSNYIAGNINKSIILAYSKKERDLLKSYWENNQLLIIAALMAYEDSNCDNRQHDWARLMDNNGTLYTKSEYIQELFNLYRYSWLNDEDFKIEELAKTFRLDFNKKLGSSAEICEDGKINIYKPNLLRKRFENYMDADDMAMTDEHLIRKIYEQESQNYSPINAFNSRAKEGISGCRDIIDEKGLVKKSNSNVDDILHNCSKINIAPCVRIIDYPKEYQQVLVDFWTVNKSLIMASVRVMSDSDQLSESFKKGIKQTYDDIAKPKWKRYNISINNGTLQESGNALFALGVFKWYIQTLIWSGSGPAAYKKANSTLMNICNTNQDIIQNKRGEKGDWIEISKPDWAHGESTSYYFNKGNYNQLFDKLHYYLKNNQDGYSIDEIS